ncbi:MAG: DUF4157 domain-containing protein [Methanomethylovorans sp.]|nr:DUF4157 domain-containing protein [Methanomethylovorans sp.]
MAEKAAVYAKAPEQKQKNSGICKQESHANNSGFPADRILHLQRTAGNQAVQRLIRSGALQAKLRIGQPHDIYEQEADRVAEQVMRMPEPQVQRKCAKCKKKLELLQPKAMGSITNTVPPIVHEVLSTPGQPLDPVTRAFMEPRFGHDFSNVRVYSKGQAATSAEAVNAHAYTVGQSIVFANGKYEPGTDAGKQLIAHELAHVVQQTGHPDKGNSLVGNFIMHSANPSIQRKWRLDSITPKSAIIIQYTSGNASQKSLVFGNGVYGEVYTWQEQGFIHQQEGGRAHISRWVTWYYIFRNDGADNDFLWLGPTGQFGGIAKAEDLDYARGAAIVWSRITERSADNPTPPSQPLFQTGGGGISAATVGDLGLIEAEIPIGESGSVKLTLPLTKVDEGDFAPFSDSEHVTHSVPATMDEVDVMMGARIEADADIETAFFGISPLISQNVNYSKSIANFWLDWESRPAPGSGSQRSPATEASPGIAGATYACAICKCSGDKECGGGRIHTIWMGKTECNRENKAKAQQLCNHDRTFLSICDLSQKRPDGKKCSVHHHDFACSDRETEERCAKRRQ